MSIAVTSLPTISLLIAATVTWNHAASTLAGDGRPKATDRQSFTVQVGSKVRLIEDHQDGELATTNQFSTSSTDLRLESTGMLVVQLSSTKAERPWNSMTPILIHPGRTTIQFRSQKTKSAGVDARTGRTLRVHWTESDLPVITIAAP